MKQLLLLMDNFRSLPTVPDESVSVTATSISDSEASRRRRSETYDSYDSSSDLYSDASYEPDSVSN